MKKLLKSWYVVLLCASGIGVASAHHSFALFDFSKQVKLTGVVKQWEWTNPHCWLFVSVPTPEGVQEWQIEALSPNVLGREGWRKSLLKPGDRVIATINPTRDGSHGGNLLMVTDADGHIIGPPLPSAATK